MRVLPIGADQIPDFRRLSDVLMKHTGWQVVAVPGLVPDEVFFEHLANRRFPAGGARRRCGLAVRPPARGGGAAPRWQFAKQPRQSVLLERVSGWTFGWVEGRNLRIDYRFAGDPSRLAADAEGLVNLRPDVIFAFSAGGPGRSAAHISHPDCLRGRR
jgi:hypothetical protein